VKDNHEFTNCFTAENGCLQSSQGSKGAIVFCHKDAKAQREKK